MTSMSIYSAIDIAIIFSTFLSDYNVRRWCFVTLMMFLLINYIEWIFINHQLTPSYESRSLSFSFIFIKNCKCFAFNFIYGLWLDLRLGYLRRSRPRFRKSKFSIKVSSLSTSLQTSPLSCTFFLNLLGKVRNWESWWISYFIK